jgi:hypothetical protein
MGDKSSFLDASTNGKATLATSRRSFIWKQCAGVALGLCLPAIDLTALIMVSKRIQRATARFSGSRQTHYATTAFATPYPQSKV